MNRTHDCGGQGDEGIGPPNGDLVAGARKDSGYRKVAAEFQTSHNIWGGGGGM